MKAFILFSALGLGLLAVAGCEQRQKPMEQANDQFQSGVVDPAKEKADQAGEQAEKSANDVKNSMKQSPRVEQSPGAAQSPGIAQSPGVMSSPAPAPSAAASNGY
jgi:hypothetical protein